MAKKQQTPAAEPQDHTQTQPATQTEPQDAAMAPIEPEQQPTDAAPAAEPAAPVAPPPAERIPAEPLGMFITRHEDAAMALGIVVTLITHPSADECVHAGRYGGIRLAAGDALATYSDGTQHQ
ncbi:hypothetical protein ACOTJS_19525 [Achromobacter xylosoxidans]